MHDYEHQYINLIARILAEQELRNTRNGTTLSIFGHSIVLDLANGFPLLQGRRLYYLGVFGEFAAMIRKPTCIQDFKNWGCNYWDQWADAAGDIVLDYGNAWHEHGQIQQLKYCLANDQTNRRMLISGWRPERLADLSLPCCHFNYQFYVRDGKYLDMIWSQRSVDVMVGLPSDAVFAAVWLISLANEFHLEPGRVKMDFGDCHIYTEHMSKVTEYIENARDTENAKILYSYLPKPGTDFCTFEPGNLVIPNYNPGPALSFKVIS